MTTARRAAVLVILDGMRRDLIAPELTPNICALMGRGTQFLAYRSVFPSATRVVSSCTATGCWPAHHGLRGNSMALIEAGQIVPHDAGHPDFLQHRRRVTGRALDRPTMAERLAGRGGSVVFSNVSPGAAYAHDPDGFGFVYHRAGSFGPGRVALDDGIGDVTLDAAGDAAMTRRFLDEAVGRDGRHPALAVLWLGEPDSSQHKHPLGSPAANAAIAAADARLGEVMAAVDRSRADGDAVLLLAGSDHGHQTVTEVIDINAVLAEAGFKSAGESAEDGLIAVSNGTGCLVYLSPVRTDGAEVVAFLRAQAWCARLYDAADLPEIGQAASGGLLCAVTMRCDGSENEFGVPGCGASAKPLGAKPGRLGFGQHGGLGRWEQMPFMIAEGAGFAAGGVDGRDASPVDLAPTILGHLGVAADGCDGASLL